MLFRSGLSEPGHAGGQFPRPDLHERLDRVLSKLKPDVIVACYGMNDGIYYPFGEERFAAFQSGMRRLREKASAAGAKVIHVVRFPQQPAHQPPALRPQSDGGDINPIAGRSLRRPTRMNERCRRRKRGSGQKLAARKRVI